MPQDRRTKEFKKDREERLKARMPGDLITPEGEMVEPTSKNVIPDTCIWCSFPLHKAKAVCPSCQNCQSCGMHQPQGGHDMCYLCGNKVPETKVKEQVPSFQRMRGRPGMVKRSRQDVRIHRGKGRKQKP